MESAAVLNKFIITTLFFLPFFAFCQVRDLDAVKTTQLIKIDGSLNDDAWSDVPTISDFIMFQPTYGNPSSHKTEVKIVYNNTAIYIGAILHSTDIRTQLTERDKIDRQDVDFFIMGFDTYQDRQNAFVFRVSAAGVQADAKLSNSGTTYDSNWDAVWESKVKVNKDHWIVEAKIPFSAIRFSKNKLQNWGLNFGRVVRSKNELSVWSPMNPNVAGDVNQWGNWNNLKDIKPPLRLSFSPYLSGGIKISPTQNGNITEYLKSGGMDVKYGINESFTLDMTLIPDFAQVQSDNVFLNLTPFQVKFDDYRPFFTEGTELFNKAGLFYSRRIGATPTYSNSVLQTYGNNSNYRLNKNPGITRLINATKVSGRTKSNLGIGFFNALTAPMYASIKNLNTNTDSSILTEPLTNYNIIVLDKAFKNRSYLTFTNTNVIRKDNSRNANVIGIDFSLFDKKNKYNFFIANKLSSIWGNQGKKDGFKTVATFGKVSGNFQYTNGINIESDKYDPNDLGFLQNPNAFENFGSVSYNYNKPTKNYLNHSYSFSYANTYLYKPFKWSQLQLNANAFYLFKNFWDIKFNLITNPFGTNDYFVNSSDYNGYFLKKAPFLYLSVRGSSDSRKKLFFNYELGGAESPLPTDPLWQGTLGLRYRFSNKFQLGISSNVEQDRGNWGWAFMNNANGSPIISRRDVKKNTTILTSQYSFTARMNVSFRLRHYWSLITNTNFYNVKPDGYWDEIAFIPNKNINVNVFNIDMFYTWDFLLGSRLTIGWKNALGSNVNFDAYQNRRYIKNLGQTLSNPHSNEVTIKLVYFLDYLKLRKK